MWRASPPHSGGQPANAKRNLVSSSSPLPPPPAEKATARKDQAGKASARDWAGSWCGIGSDDAREVAGRRIVIVERCGVAKKRGAVLIERRYNFEPAEIAARGILRAELIGRANRAQQIRCQEIGIPWPGIRTVGIETVFVDDAKYGHIESYRCIDDHGIGLEHIHGKEIAVNDRARCNRAGIGDEWCEQRDALLLSKDDLVRYAVGEEVAGNERRCRHLRESAGRDDVG
jgi:hypothetical protein